MESISFNPKETFEPYFKIVTIERRGVMEQNPFPA